MPQTGRHAMSISASNMQPQNRGQIHFAFVSVKHWRMMASRLTGLVFGEKAEATRVSLILKTQDYRGRRVTESVLRGPSRLYWSSGLPSCRTIVCMGPLSHHYLEDSIDWWDSRKSKLQPKSPDFRHKSTKEALWIDENYTLKWVTYSLTRKTLCMKAGRDRDESGEFKPVNAADLKSPQHNEYSCTALILQYTKSGQNRKALRLYEDMQKDGAEASARTFVALLKACSSLQDLKYAKWLHAEVVRRGCESDLYVGNMLVDVYAKCGSLVDARLAFEQMPSRDVVSWTSMILGYAQMRKGEEALQMYTRMQQAGVVANERTYVCVLKACSAMAESGKRKDKCLEAVRAIHRNVIRGNFEADVFVGTMLVDAYAKCGSLDEATQVFENMPHRDVVSWNAMILGYAQLNMGEAALQLYTRMQLEGMVQDRRTYVCALKACSSLAESGERTSGIREKCLARVKAIHADVVKGKFESGVFVGNVLIDAYAKCRSLEDARRVFEKMPNRDVISWNAMILGYAHVGRGEEALQLFTRMQQEGVIPDDRTYVSGLKACSTLAGLEQRNKRDAIPLKSRYLKVVKQFHAYVVKGKFYSDLFVGNALVDAYAKCGSLDDARCVFEKMHHRDVVSWNAMILGYSQMEQGEEALQLYTRMSEEGVVPDERTYVAALKACSSLAELEESNESDGLAVRRKCLDIVRSVHKDVMKQRLKSDVFVGTMLVDAYAKCGSLEDARQVFEELPCRDVVSWTAMILAYAQMDKGEDALKLFTQMQRDGVAPNDRTYLSVLKACGSVAGLEIGKKIHAQILKAGLESVHSYMVVGLIDMYARCGSMVDAQQVFEASHNKDTATWSALMLGYAHQGESDLVFDLFKRMKHGGIEPDGVTFLGLLSACNHVGFVEKGQKYFEAMRTDYGITPTIKHFTCIVDLLGRAGQLDRAMELVKTMPFQPGSAVWNSLLGACRKWSNVELGREAFECAVRLDKNDAVPYVQMSNIYAAAHMQRKAKQIHAMRIKSLAWKQPGRSWWMDMSGIKHMFMAGDQEHPESLDIYAKLRDLLVRIKRAG